MRINLQYAFLAHRYLYDRLNILHCDLSISNVLLNRKDNKSEPVGLLIDFDYSVNTVLDRQETAVNAVATHAAEDTLIRKRGVAAEVPLDTFEARGVQVEARKAAAQRETHRTVRSTRLHGMSTNYDLRAGYTTLYGHRGPS